MTPIPPLGNCLSTVAPVAASCDPVTGQPRTGQ
jgi:hypothetical protein